jgi:outer membrane protein assembly factor BamB
VVHAGKYNNPAYEWGTASSPVLYHGQVIVLCDAIENGFLAAFDVTSGREAWRTQRKVNPSWSTPAVYEGPDRVEIITNADPFIQGYDARAVRSCGGWVPVRRTPHPRRSLARA